MVNMKTKQGGFFVIGAGVTIAIVTALAGTTAYVVQDKGDEQIVMERSVELVDNLSTYRADEN